MTGLPAAVTLSQVSATWLAGFASGNTRAAYHGDLRTYLAWCSSEAHPPLEATAAVMVEYRARRESDGMGPATIARQFAALRSFYATAHDLGACRPNPFDARTPAVTYPSATGVLAADDVERLHASAAADARSAVLVGLLLGDGLRLAEALAIDHEHLTGPATRKQLHVHRHGRTSTIVLSTSTSSAVDRLQRASTRHGALLLAQPHGPGAGERLTRFGADYLIKQSGHAAGIDHALSANVLRRTHAALAQLAGVHIDDIRERMGHRDVRTTRRYLAPASPATDTLKPPS